MIFWGIYFAGAGTHRSSLAVLCFGQGRSIRWRRLRGSKSMWSRSWSTDVWCLPTQTASTALAPAFKMTLHPPQVTCSEVSFFPHPPSNSLFFMAILQSPPSPVPALPPEGSQAGSQQPSKTYCPQAQTQAWPGPQHCLSFPLTPKMWREVWNAASPPPLSGEAGWSAGCGDSPGHGDGPGQALLQPPWL